MNDIRDHKPAQLGYYKVRLKVGSPLYRIYGMQHITARFVERVQKGEGAPFF